MGDVLHAVGGHAMKGERTEILVQKVMGLEDTRVNVTLARGDGSGFTVLETVELTRVTTGGESAALEREAEEGERGRGAVEERAATRKVQGGDVLTSGIAEPWSLDAERGQKEEEQGGKKKGLRNPFELTEEDLKGLKILDEEEWAGNYYHHHNYRVVEPCVLMRTHQTRVYMHDMTYVHVCRHTRTWRIHAYRQTYPQYMYCKRMDQFWDPHVFGEGLTGGFGRG